MGHMTHNASDLWLKLRVPWPMIWPKWLVTQVTRDASDLRRKWPMTHVTHVVMSQVRRILASRRRATTKVRFTGCVTSWTLRRWPPSDNWSPDTVSPLRSSTAPPTSLNSYYCNSTSHPDRLHSVLEWSLPTSVEIIAGFGVLEASRPDRSDPP